ncbi:MAG: GNAT family N-acetyltransferase [Candidatus Aquirickettsiella gammari]|jgi:L-amino acid N-acyltransferase YncA|uniref:GNAT family N-acetyltransferase n=1 Tax=Candidatus Aquirickettsiella gammari TaxID=2016198 RepID=A0A370CHW8_9COXI|nr:MAG: GNAT family N-acetyltransferase [Candidatus Aquirickettsiella gammari]
MLNIAFSLNEETIHIRKATLLDTMNIAKLHHTVWKSTLNGFVDNAIFEKISRSFFVNKWRDWLSKKNKVSFVAEQENFLLGFFTIDTALNNHPEIQFIYVAYKYQFSNLQKLLFEAAFKKSAKLGFSKLYFCIAKENKKDLVLYKLMKGYLSQTERVNQIYGFEFNEICYEFDLNAS